MNTVISWMYQLNEGFRSSTFAPRQIVSEKFLETHLSLGRVKMVIPLISFAKHPIINTKAPPESGTLVGSG